MGARYYQPGAGRFTQFDPLPRSENKGQRYVYAGNNPVSVVDPEGINHYANHGCR